MVMLWSRGAQMFKDAEAGDKEINIERTEDALETKTDIIAVVPLQYDVD
jgi:hypothetical protein